MLRRRNALIFCLILASGGLSLPAVAQQTIDMSGKTVMITGSTSGLGATVAQRLGALGATVIVHGRSEERGAEVVAAINAAGPGRAVFYRADLASLDDVEALAAQVRANHPQLNLLINNAGIGGSTGNERRESADGYELTFAINYLSHFHLTRELLPLIEASAPARIVNVASVGQAAVNFDDVMLENSFSQMNAYSQSKLAQIMFTISLSEMLDPDEVTVNSLHPATFMDTPMVVSTGRQPMSSVEDGADAVMQLAVGAALEGRTGLYFNSMEEARARVQQAYDADARQQLWDLSLDLVENR